MQKNKIKKMKEIRRDALVCVHIFEIILNRLELNKLSLKWVTNWQLVCQHECKKNKIASIKNENKTTNNVLLKWFGRLKHLCIYVTKSK